MMHYGESDYWVAHYRSLTEGRAKVLLAPPRPLRGSCPPRAQRPPRRGGSGQRPAPAEGDGRFGVTQAKAARSVIARFGRHPHRNEILDRTSTPEELEYLRTEIPTHLRRPPSELL
jgi:hypothetical protein